MKIEKILEKIEVEYKGRAVDEYGECKYKTDDGRKCAIGLFIPERHEGQESESNVLGLLNEYKDLRKHLPSNDIDKLLRFQGLHDSGRIYNTFDDFEFTNLSVDEQKFILMYYALDLFTE